MYRMIYASRLTAPLADHELNQLLADSRVRNEAADLTGLLLLVGPDIADEPGFLQVLEGERGSVEATYARIARDRRHRDLRRVRSGSVSERLFPAWRMGLELVTHEDLARAVPGFAVTGHPLVDIADLANDPVRAEQLLVTATY